MSTGQLTGTLYLTGHASPSRSPHLDLSSLSYRTWVELVGLKVPYRSKRPYLCVQPHRGRRHCLHKALPTSHGLRLPMVFPISSGGCGRSTHKVFAHRLQKTWQDRKRAVWTVTPSVWTGAGDTQRRALWWLETGCKGRGVGFQCL